jgi:hypothetical protein
MKANEAPETYPIQFRDKIDEYLWKEHHILGGCCSSIESLKYTIAREVVEKLTDTFIKKAVEWLENLFAPDGSIVPENIKLIEDFKNYMKGE